MTICGLRRELTDKEAYAAKLKLVMRQRSQTIDRLHDKLEQARAQNRKLDEENDHLVDSVYRWKD
jgi:hypothetical protein